MYKLPRKFRIFASMLLLLSSTACSPIVLLGNYEGKVIDGASGEGLENATVRVEWSSVHFGVVDSFSKQIDEYVTKTDKNGMYHIPLRLNFVSLLGHFDYTEFEISKDDYNNERFGFSKDIFENDYNDKKYLTIKLNKRK